MYVFPGDDFNCRVQFKAGGDPASPSLAAFTVSDVAGEVVPSTPITLNAGATEAWVSVPGSEHTLGPNDRYRQYRVEVTHTTDGLVFKQHFTYFVVPDLFLNFTETHVRLMVGLSKDELPDDQVDFYGAYLNLLGTDIADNFVAALNAEVDSKLFHDARQLIFYSALQNLMPTVRLKALKSIQSETSKIQRMASESTFDSLETLIKNRYDIYYGIVRSSGSQSAPVFIVLDTPTDAITGA